MSDDPSRWHLASAYDYVDDLPVSDIAWEWLRRNEDYQSDFARTEEPRTDPRRLTRLMRRRWGLRFPGSPRPNRTTGNHTLAS